jgi:hypothetical protein
MGVCYARAQPVALKQLFACAAGGKGGPPPLHPRPMGTAPWNPKMMWLRGECQMWMALGRYKQQAMISI